MYDEIKKKLSENLDKRTLKEEFLFDQDREKKRKKGAPQGATPDFGRAIKLLLTQKNIKESALARLCGVHEKTIRNIENHSIINPSFDSLERIASALEVSFPDFMNLAWTSYRGNLYKTSASESHTISFDLEKGFSIHVFSPPARSKRDFFLGVVTVRGKTKLNYWKFPGTSAKACIQPWDGKIIFTYHGMNWKKEEEVAANTTLYFDPAIPHSFENPFPETVRMLLATYPSLF